MNKIQIQILIIKGYTIQSDKGFIITLVK